MIRNYRSSTRGIEHFIDYTYHRFEKMFVLEDGARKARTVKSAYIVGKKKKEGKEKEITKRNSYWTRLMVAIISARNDVGYLACRLRFQIGIRIANAPIGKVLWIYCVSKGKGAKGGEREREDDEKGCTWRGTEAFDCTLGLIKVFVRKRCVQRHLSLYLLNIGRWNFYDPASRIDNMLHLLLHIVNRYRDNPCESR